MWISFVHEDLPYILKSNIADDTIEIHLNNLQNVWSEVLRKEEAFQRFMELNPLLIIDKEIIFTQIEEILNNFDKPQNVSINGESFHLEIFSNKDGEQMRFNLQKQSPEEFINHFTVPMIQTVLYLEFRQKQLCEIISKKDAEIREYQLEKGYITRGSKATGKFNTDKVENFKSNKLVLNLFSKSTDFSACFNKNYGNILEEIPDLKPKATPKKRVLKKYVSEKRALILNTTGVKKIKKEADD